MAKITRRPAESETFRVERIDPVAAYVDVNGRRIDGEMFFDGPTTGPAGVRGIAGVAAGQIAVLPLLPLAVYAADVERDELAYEAEVERKQQARLKAHPPK